MNWLRNLFSRPNDDQFLLAYHLGYQDGRDDEQRRILADAYKRMLASERFPNARDTNVISISRHHNYLPRGR